MAVPAVCHLRGSVAMIDHPGLAVLRVAPEMPQGPDQLERP
jgi:hypothetical protein